MGRTLMVDEVLRRIQQVTSDLREIRELICDHVFPADEPKGSSLFSAAGASTEVIGDFKATLDDVRHLVWLYLEAIAHQPATNGDSQRKLLARASEILGALSQRPPLPIPDLQPTDRSLVDRLLLLIENRIDPKELVKKEALRKNGC